MSLLYLKMFHALLTFMILISFMIPIIEEVMTFIVFLLTLCVIVLSFLSYYVAFPPAMVFFLILISGLSVVFTFMLAMWPNMENKEFQSYPSYLISLFILFTLLKEPFLKPLLETEYAHKFWHLFSAPSLPLYLLFTIILLMTMVVVVSLSFKSPKPVRNMTK